MKTLPLLWVFACPTVIAAPCTQVIQQASSLMARQAFLPMLQVLAPMEAQCAGEPSFDYLLGNGLLQTGNPDAASWALERVTAAQPRHGGAWLDLAEAYLRIGETQRAREALQHAILLNPPMAARNKIIAIQNALSEMKSPWRASAYTTLEFGRDSNVNSATSLSTIAIPSLGNVLFNLDARSKYQSSLYRDEELGGVLDWKSSTTGEYFILPKLKNRYYSDLHQFNRDIYSVQFGHGQRYLPGDLITSLQFEKQMLGGRPYLLTRGATAEWRSQLTAKTQVRLSGQYLSDRYADPSQYSNNADRYVLGAAISQQFCHDLGRFTLAMVRSKEQAIQQRAYGDKRSLLVYSDINFRLLPNLDAQLSVAHQADDYQNIDPFFLQVRSERQWSYSVGLSATVAHNYLLTGTLTKIRNDVNIPVYGYQRTLTSISVRRDF